MKAVQERDDRLLVNDYAPVSDHAFPVVIEMVADRRLIHGEMTALGSVIVAWATGQQDELVERLERSMVRFRPVQIGLTRDELRQVLEDVVPYLENGGVKSVVAGEPIVGDRFDALWEYLKRKPTESGSRVSGHRRPYPSTWSVCRPSETILTPALLLGCPRGTRAGATLVSRNMNELTTNSGRALTILTALCAGLLIAALACSRGSDELATSTPSPPEPCRHRPPQRSQYRQQCLRQLLTLRPLPFPPLPRRRRQKRRAL